MIKNSRHFFQFQFILCIFAAGIGCLLCNYTADMLSKPAQKLMEFITSKGKMPLKMDEHGIPQVYYSRLKGAFINPGRVAMLANWLYEHRNNPEKGADNIKTFLKYADWLKNNLRIVAHDGLDYGIWEYHFYYETYKLKPPWRSGMAQAAGVNALGKAFLTTNDAAYLTSAKYALNAFLVNTNNGGVTYQDTDQEWWIEEYIGDTGQETRVLNGAIYALLDVYEFWKTTGDPTAWDVYRRGLNSIRKQLSKYDMGWWSYYDAIGTIATQNYHTVHIRLTRDLYNISGEEVFLEYSERWAKYRNSYFKREFIKQRPDYHDMVILGLNVLGVWITGNLVAVLLLIYRKMVEKHT